MGAIISSSKRYDLEERTLQFAKKIIQLTKEIQLNLQNIEISKQLIRSTGSVGANYIEANEALGKKDFMMRIKICKKEAKESRYWLNLLETNSEISDKARQNLIQESTELMKIFGAILEKSK
ncbi:four helix bundle protein [candidate division KSB1 bacterium]|nr:four helix bundle protein [candidate division KSB1 bacterium]